MATCKGCGTEIEWRRNDVTAKRAPIDSEPVPEGNIEKIGAAGYRVIRPDEDYEGERFFNHFSVCPNADQFRRDPITHRPKGPDD